MFDSAAGQVSDTATFEIKTTAVEITAVAKVDALEGEDPFDLGTFIKLIKSVSNPSPAVPEQSIGGWFSVDGSAYLIGCDRIISQFVLVAPFDSRLGAGALAGRRRPRLQIIAPIPTRTRRTIRGNLVAPSDHPEHDPERGPGRRMVEVRNARSLASPTRCQGQRQAELGQCAAQREIRGLPRSAGSALPGAPSPAPFAAKDQVAIWIDNQQPIGVITSIGGITGCGDLHLKDYVGTTAEIRGIAWDPPIDSAAPQQRPNENFGSYGLTYKKNGELSVRGDPRLHAEYSCSECLARADRTGIGRPARAVGHHRGP